MDKLLAIVMGKVWLNRVPIVGQLATASA